MKIAEIGKDLSEKLPIHGKVATIAKGFAKEMASKLFLRTISAASRIKNADREKLILAMKAGSVVFVGFLIASKLFGLQMILAVAGGSVMLSDLLDRVDNESDKQKIKEAFEALNVEPKPVAESDSKPSDSNLEQMLQALKEGKPFTL